MIHHTEIHWPTGIWQPAGLPLAIVEEDGVPIDSIVNAFIRLAGGIGIDAINDTVKEGPAGLIARLESATELRQNDTRGAGSIRVDSLAALAAVDTSDIEVRHSGNRGNARALIYPSGRALLSYLYDTSFFNAIDELVQHGNLNVRGKLSSHKLTEVHLSLVATFYQGALVTMTSDSRVQNNMTALLRQLMILWPTSGSRRFPRAKRIDQALAKIEKVAKNGHESLVDLSEGILRVPSIPHAADESLLESEGAGVRYTVLNRSERIAKVAIAVAFWRIAEGGKFEITNGDLAVADSILHLHEMGGRLFELVMSKGRLGHEFMRLFVRLLAGESIQGEELAHASEVSAGATAQSRLQEFSILQQDGKLADEYRYVLGRTIREHKARWKLK